MQRAEAPVLQLAHKVPGADALGEVELALAVQAQDVLEYPRGPVKVELPPLQRVRVAQAEYLRCNKHIISHHGHWDMRAVALRNQN